MNMKEYSHEEPLSGQACLQGIMCAQGGGLLWLKDKVNID